MPHTIPEQPNLSVLEQENPKISNEFAESLIVAELVGDIAISETLMNRAEKDREVVETYVEEIKSRRAQRSAGKMIDQGFACLTPRFSDQVIDESRTNRLTYATKGSLEDESLKTKDITETAGLQQLYDVLARFINSRRDTEMTPETREARDWAIGILDNMSYIGGQEYEEATRGLAAYWKDYLDEDPNRQICLLAAISDSDRYKGETKSDMYLRDQALATFSDEELTKYSGRIVSRLEDVTVLPTQTKVAIIDDWVISGRQVRTAYGELMKEPLFRKYAEQDAVEINVIVASKDRIENGLSVEGNSPDVKDRLKLVSYYKSRDSREAWEAKSGNNSHISGSHSSVNYDFNRTLNKKLVKLMSGAGGIDRRRVALGHIVPPYKSKGPSIAISAHELKRISEDEK